MKELIHKEIFSSEPTSMVVLFELILKDLNKKSYRFHAGENGHNKEIIFNGKNYHYLPIKAEGFDYADKKLPRPIITADNTESFFSLKTRFFKDFIGYELIRTRTFAKFLDSANFPNNTNPYGTPTAVSYPPEKYIINRKIKEDISVISFELVSPMEYENAKIPNRKIVYNVCQWQYRHHVGCGYNGLPVCDSKGNNLSYNPTGTPASTWDSSRTYNQGDYVQILPDPAKSNAAPSVYVCLTNTTSSNPQSDKANWIADSCSKNLSGCRARFGDTEVTNGLPFGGFPGTWQY